MGKRKSSRKPVKKVVAKLDSSFNCLFCNHNNSITCNLDKKILVGSLRCKICGTKFQTKINVLSQPVDVYSDWFDAVEEVNSKDNRKSYGTSQNGGSDDEGSSSDYESSSEENFDSDDDDLREAKKARRHQIIEEDEDDDEDEAEYADKSDNQETSKSPQNHNDDDDDDEEEDSDEDFSEKVSSRRRLQPESDEE
ncbi:hypothetical protein ACO0QE_000390 [Hanseniaspora vineae]